MQQTQKKTGIKKRAIPGDIAFDHTKCLLCGRCVDICPGACLKIMEIKVLSQVMKENKKNESLLNLEGGTAILKNRALCNHCGLCIRHCLAQAIYRNHDFFEKKLL